MKLICRHPRPDQRRSGEPGRRDRPRSPRRPGHPLPARCLPVGRANPISMSPGARLRSALGDRPQVPAWAAGQRLPLYQQATFSSKVEPPVPSICTRPQSGWRADRYQAATVTRKPLRELGVQLRRRPGPRASRSTTRSTSVLPAIEDTGGQAGLAPAAAPATRNSAWRSSIWASGAAASSPRSCTTSRRQRSASASAGPGHQRLAFHPRLDPNRRREVQAPRRPAAPLGALQHLRGRGRPPVPGAC